MLTNRTIQGILIAVIPQLIGIQGVVEIIIEDIVFPTLNKEYLSEPDVFIDINNKVFSNLTIIKQFPPETQVHFQLLGASMGEYVIQTGLDLEMNLCEMINEPIVLGFILRVSGFSANDCPPSPGIYGSQGFSIPTEIFPDGFTPNKYLVIGEFLYGEEKLLVFHVYCNIQ